MKKYRVEDERRRCEKRKLVCGAGEVILWTKFHLMRERDPKTLNRA